MLAPPTGHTVTVQTLPQGAVESCVVAADTHWRAIPALISQTPFLIGKCHGMLGFHGPFPFVVLGIKLRVCHMLSKWSTTELYPESLRLHILNAACLRLS